MWLGSRLSLVGPPLEIEISTWNSHGGWTPKLKFLRGKENRSFCCMEWGACIEFFWWDNICLPIFGLQHWCFVFSLVFVSHNSLLWESGAWLTGLQNWSQRTPSPQPPSLQKIQIVHSQTCHNVTSSSNIQANQVQRIRGSPCGGNLITGFWEQCHFPPSFPTPLVLHHIDWSFMLFTCYYPEPSHMLYTHHTLFTRYITCLSYIYVIYNILKNIWIYIIQGLAAARIGVSPTFRLSRERNQEKPLGRKNLVGCAHKKVERFKSYLRMTKRSIWDCICSTDIDGADRFSHD